MISATLKAAGYLLFACSVLVYAQPPAKKATSTISGKVTLKGNAIAGIPVGARSRQSNTRENRPLGAITDAQGNYRISNVPPGSYEIGPVARQYVTSADEPVKLLIVTEGETYENVDFTLVRGGVITGRITNAEGEPVIEQEVSVSGPEGSSQAWMVHAVAVFVPADDRGIYRIFGLPPGKYKVWAGRQNEAMPFGRNSRHNYGQTFYGGTSEPNKATLVEVTEGGEATNVDITLRRTQATFTVTGKIVDAETGRPIPNAGYGLTRYRADGTSSHSGMRATGQGEFRFDNVTPGNYSAYLDSSPLLDIYAEPLKFEVTDQDIKGLVIKASAGSSISGVVVVEGLDSKFAGKQLKGMVVSLKPTRDQNDAHLPWGATSTMTSDDGSFRLNSVPPGVIQFLVYTQATGELKPVDLNRVERNGVVEARGIEVKAREQVSGVRLIVKVHNGAIRGVVKIENRELRAGERAFVTAIREGDEMSQASAQADARGQFYIEGLKAGVYELKVYSYSSDSQGQWISLKQQVVVVDNQVSDVIVKLERKPER